MATHCGSHTRKKRPACSFYKRQVMPRASYRIFLLLFFLGLLFKSEMPRADEQYFVDWPAYVGMLKSNSWVLYGLSSIVGLALVGVRLGRSIKRSAALLLLAAFVVASIRAAMYDAALGLKVAGGLCIFIFLLMVSESEAQRRGVATRDEDLFWALRAAVMVLIAVNAVALLQGYGYSAVGARFYGTSIHPNFMAIQLAISALIFLHELSGKKSMILNGFALAVTIGLLFLTGSRTGFVVVCAGAIAAISTSRKSLLTLGLVAAAMLAVYLAYVAYMPASAAFDRGDQGSDTRSDVWLLMMEAFLSSPLSGVGFVSEASENSYLRAFATYGAIHGCLILIAVAQTLVNARRLAQGRNNKVATLLLSMASGLAVGAVLEGYLVDVLSFPLAVFFCCAMASTKPPRNILDVRPYAFHH
jgi:hypothetical protein